MEEDSKAQNHSAPESSDFTLKKELSNGWMEELSSDPVTMIASNACWKNDIVEICTKRNIVSRVQHVYSNKVETEGKPVTNQRSSGRCWLFATLNVMRIPFCKSLNIDEFEFSQAHLFFWDKIERCNYFLNRMVECYRSGEPVEGRLVSFLLTDPTCDGGQWDMIVNLISKYGVMPKKCFPDSYSCENTTRMNRILQSKLREYTMEIRTHMKAEGTSQASVDALLERQMKEVFKIVSIAVGVPPDTFTWQYYDKSKVAKSVGPISSLEFYEQHVKPLFDVTEKVCLVNDPRPSNPYGKLYSVDCLGNMSGGRSTIYNNQPIETLMEVTAASIKAGEAVWFGCEVSKCFSSKYGVQDTAIHDYKSILGVDVNVGLTKAERLIYGDSLMTHAMTFTACHFEDTDDKLPAKWRVENSWGEDRGDKGYHILTKDWFSEYVFEVVVDKSFVSEEVLAVQSSADVVKLPAWDPMGALARNRISHAL